MRNYFTETMNSTWMQAMPYSFEQHEKEFRASQWNKPLNKKKDE
jgi:hypothetical protein